MKNFPRLTFLTLSSIIILSLMVNTQPSTAGECGNANPTVSTDCTSASIQTNYCCFMTPINGGDSFCNYISPPSYQVSMTTFTLEGVSYNIDCDITEGTPGTPCGIVGPSKTSDCSTFSLETNSCCYYNLDDDHYCLWLGSKGSGQIMPTVDCGKSSYISTITLFLTVLFALVI